MLNPKQSSPKNKFYKIAYLGTSSHTKEFRWLKILFEKIQQKRKDPKYQDKFEDKIFNKSCTHSYVIKNGIPRFVENKNYTDSFGLQWNFFQKTTLQPIF